MVRNEDDSLFNESSYNYDSISEVNREYQKGLNHGGNSMRHNLSEDRVINQINILNLIKEKSKKHGLPTNSNPALDQEILDCINSGLETYMRNILEKLIQISRNRQIHLDLFSKAAEKYNVNSDI